MFASHYTTRVPEYGQVIDLVTAPANSPRWSRGEIFETGEDLATIFKREDFAARIDPVKEPKKKGKKGV